METIKEAKEYLKDNFEKGCSCPTCNQFVKLYKRKLGSPQTKALILLYHMNKKNNDEWVHVRDITRDLNVTSDFSKNVYWKLIEEKPLSGEDKKTSGFWRITDKGKAFVERRIKLKSHVLIYNAKIIGFSENYTDIISSLGKRFSYRELMNNT